MNGMKTEEMGSRKKYLAPVVVLLLCLVSLTGAAYAYSSSVNVLDNQVDSHEFVLDVTKSDNTTSITEPIQIKVMDLGHVTQTSSAGTTILVKGYAEPVAKYSGKIIIKDTTVTAAGSKAVAVSFTVPFTGTDGKNGVINASEVTGATGTGSITITLTAKLYLGDASGARTETEYTNSVNFNASGEAVLYYDITANVSGDGIEFNSGTSQAAVTAVKNRIALETFKILCSATVTTA